MEDKVNILLYCVILLAKITEVTVATTRIVLITRGERLLGAILGFFEVIIWIILVSTVLTDITSDPFKVVIYAAGFAIGNYTGSLFEQKLGIGTVRVEAIVMEKDGYQLASSIREKGYAVTIIQGQGMNFNRNILLMNIKRKDYLSVVQLIRATQTNVVITINDIKPVYGGHGILKK